MPVRTRPTIRQTTPGGVLSLHWRVCCPISMQRVGMGGEKQVDVTLFLRVVTFVLTLRKALPFIHVPAWIV